MSELLKKLQWKPEQSVLLLGNRIESLEGEIGSMKRESVANADAVLIAVVKSTQWPDLWKQIEALAKTKLDGISLWVAYPKAKALGTDLSRDKLWPLLAEVGWGPVRQIAIDETWSALRFRPEHLIERTSGGPGSKN